MHVLINVKSLNNISKWQMRFNSAFKGLKNKRIRACSVLERFSFECGGLGDESFCSVKHRGFCSLLRVLVSKGLSCMHLSSVKE
jgi:hypothetical protein